MELKTIEKALKVFKCFAQGETSLGTTELARRLEINKATMSRVLSTLKKHDFLEQEPLTRRYRLGPAMVELARAVYRSLECTVVTEATPFIDALRDEVEERVHLEVLSGSNIYLAYIAETPKPISLKIEIGDQVMPHAHAGAKAIVAFSQPDVIDYWLRKDLIPYNQRTVTEPEKVRDVYAEIRKTGVAYDYGEYIEEVNAIGAPVFNHQDIPVAGLIIVIPTYRMRNKWSRNHIAKLKKAANAISARLHSSRGI
ncbi:MAG: IclR family transcriptional regulator [Bacillota bacterium]|jgi:DNA-binding IclR family transcriptional regulator